jgi:hypothetical protein
MEERLEKLFFLVLGKVVSTTIFIHTYFFTLATCFGPHREPSSGRSYKDLINYMNVLYCMGSHILVPT